MSFWILILLCFVQGLTEFLPVSSSGHLLFFEQIFGLKENLLFLNLFLHLSTLLAVIFVYRKIILKILKKPFQKYTLKLIISTALTVCFALCYEVFNLDNIVLKFYCFGFLLTSILLFLTFKFQKRAAIISNNEITTKQSIIVGAVQGLAVIPGLSRSGSTISSLVLSGADEEKAAEYSFLLSIPIIIGGFIVELIKTKDVVFKFNFLQLKMYIFAFILTFFVSLIALKVTIKLLKQKKFIIFSGWTFLMFIITLILNYFI